MTRSLGPHVALLTTCLVFAGLAGSVMGRVVIFQNYIDQDAMAESVVDEQSYVVYGSSSGLFSESSTSRDSSTHSSELRSFLTPLWSPITWMYEQLDALEAMQRSAMNDMIMQQFEVEDMARQQSWPVDQPTEASSMLEHVGCQRYRNAIQEYAQDAAEHVLAVARAFDHSVDVFEGDSDSADLQTSTLATMAGTSEDELEEQRLILAMSDALESADVRASWSSSRPQRATISDAFQHLDAQDEDEALQYEDQARGTSLGGAAIILLRGQSAQDAQRQERAELLEAQLDRGNELQYQAQLSDATAAAVVQALLMATGARPDQATSMLRGGGGSSGVLVSSSRVPVWPADEWMEYVDETDDVTATAAASYWSLQHADVSAQHSLDSDGVRSALFAMLHGSSDLATPALSPKELYDLGVVYEGEGFVDPLDIISDDGDMWLLQRPAASRGGLDLDFDGEPDLDLALFDPLTGEVNWELLALLFMLAAMAFMLVHIVCTYWQLCSSASVSQGHSLVPIMVNRGGRMVRGLMLVAEEDMEDDLEGKVGDVYGCCDVDPKAVLNLKGLSEVGAPDYEASSGKASKL